MGEILAADRVKELQDRYLPSSHPISREICLMADSHEELRARLERAEEALERLIAFVENPTYGAGAAVAEAYAALGAAGERGEG